MAVDMNKLVNLDRLKEFQTSENAATASEFSTSKSYAAGAYVYYKGKLYKFKSAHAAGAWTTTDVEEAKLADDVSTLKESLTPLIPIGNGFNKVTYSHSETTTIGSHTFMFPATIPSGTTIKITNTSTNTTQTNNLQKAGGGETNVGNLSAGQSIILTLEFDCTGIRNYINSTAWDVSVEFGGEIKAQIDKSTSDIAAIKEHNSANDTLAIGTISNGNYDSSNHLRLTDLDYIPVVKGCTVNATLSFCYAAYGSGKVLVGVSSWQAANNPLVINDDYSYIRVVLRVNDSYEFTEADLVTYADAITITYPVNDVVLDFLEKSYGEEELPSYYDTQVNTVLPNIKQEMFEAGISGESFMFFSDPHWEGNRKRSPVICKTVIDNTQISKIVCGGDLINQSATKTTMIDTMLDLVDSFKDIAPFYVALGNHDTNDTQNDKPNQRFTKSEAYSLCQKQTDQIMTYGEPCYYYFDNPTTKTRFIVLDTGLETMTTDATQIAWLESVLADAESDWHIIVFAHITYNGYPNQTITTFFSTVAGILDNNNADNSNAKVEAVFSGHLHADANYTTTGGIPIVLIDCDGSETNSASGASAGTINENCVDAVVINYITETIYCNRIGRGNSRTITY